MHALLLLALAAVPHAEPPLPDGGIARLGSPLWRDVADSGAFVTFTADGKGLIINHKDRLRLIDFESGLERWNMPGGDSGSQGVMIPGGRILLQSSSVVRIFAADSGKLERRFRTELGRSFGIASDGRYLAMREKIDSGGELVVFDLKTELKIWERGGHRANATFLPLGFVPDKPLLVALVRHQPDVFAAVLDISAKSMVSEWKLPGNPNGRFVGSLSPDGQLLCAGGDNRVHLWDVATGTEKATWEGHTEQIVSAAFSANGKRLVTSSRDKTLRWWDVATGKPLGKIEVKRIAFPIVVISPDGERAAATFDGENLLHRFDLKTGREYPIAEGHTNIIDQLGFLPDGRTLLSTSRDRTLRVWDVRSRKEIRRWVPGHISLNWLAVSADGKLVATACNVEDVVRIWDTATGEERRSMAFSPGEAVGGITFAPTGTLLAAGAAYSESQNDTIRFWDAATGAVVASFAGQRRGAGNLSFHPDGQRFASATSERAYSSERGWPGRLWDMRTGESLALEGPMDETAQFLPNGFSLAVMRQGTAPELRFVLVETASRYVRLAFDGWPGTGSTLAISPDGRWLATKAPCLPQQPRRPPGIWIWDTQTGKRAHQFDASEVSSLAFSPDGLTLASGGGDGTILLWDVAKVRESLSKVEITPKLWAELASDARTAYQAVIALGRGGEPAVALIKENLKPAPRADGKRVDEKKVAQMFADLESERFAVRQKAAGELAAAQLPAEILREQIKTTTSAEARKVLTKLLPKPAGWLTDPLRLREVRAVEALQRNGTPGARKLLEELAKGDPQARMTQEATTALRLIKP